MRQIALLMLLAALAACDTRAGRDFTAAKQAYIECVEAKGAEACEGQKAVMNATGNVYASSAGRQQAPSPAMTLGVYR